MKRPLYGEKARGRNRDSAQDLFKGRHFDKVFGFEIFFKHDIVTLIPTSMCCRFLALVVVLPLLIACNKPQKQAEINSTPTRATNSSTVRATPTPGALTTPTPAPAIDRQARVMILCYHRFEDRPHDSLVISPEEFKTQMQALKDNGIAVIPMKDFLAWRRGEKNIPPRSCIITIDDANMAFPRQVTMYRAWRHTKASLHKNGNAFGVGIMERSCTLAKLSLCA